jgi:glutamine amidotransferase
MCRLYAMLSLHSTSSTNDLLDSQNSLLCQSQCDTMNRKHPDGWGVVTYPSRAVSRVRSSEPAFMDEEFAVACRRAKSRCVVAHVRLASKGNRRTENSHPFIFKNWSFAHNGTIYAIESLRPSLVEELPKTLQRQILGETDSEVLFFWLLHRMRRAKAIINHRCVSLPRMLTILADCLVEIANRDSIAQPSREQSKATKLTVVLTNGRVMVASSLGHSLFWLQRQEQTKSKGKHQSIVLASERLTNEGWNELDNASVIGVSSSGKVLKQAFPNA